jgi:hypothetical protein
MIVISRCVGVLRNEDAQKRQRIFSCALRNFFVRRSLDGSLKVLRCK